MKKNYIAPNVKTVVLRFSTHLLQNSITGIKGIERELKYGGTTEEADSRSDRFWDDDEEEEDW